MDLKDIRQEYIREELNIEHLSKEPVTELRKWYKEAQDAEITYPNAVSLSTITKDGHPSTRIILVKEILDNSLTFFTDYNSDKGMDLCINPKASILFYWKEFDRQIRVFGTCKKVSREVSISYFNSRPRESQISAITSSQSSVTTKESLLERLKETQDKYKGTDVLPCPENWGGYEMSLDGFEFWQGRPNRLHDRFKYESINGTWKVSRLDP